MDKANELIATFLEEYEGGISELKKEHCKNAAILLSKAAFALCDMAIFEKLKKLPKNHSERFWILKEYFKDIYKVIDNIFVNYTDAYSKPVLKETCIKIKGGIDEIAKNREFPKAVKEAVK